MSSDSLLTEEVSQSLIDNQRWTIVLVDQNGNDSIIASEIELNNPYDLNLDAFLPNSVPLTLPRFFSTASDLIDDAQNRSGKVVGEKIKLVEEYPPDYLAELGDEVVAFRVLKREPARMDPEGQGRIQRGATFSYSLQSKYYPNKVIEVQSRPIDHLIEFACWAKTNRLANERALWLENLFITHKWAFTVQGAEHFFWESRGPDTYMTHGGQRLFYRPLNFKLRTREFEIRAHPQLKTMQIEISTGRF